MILRPVQIEAIKARIVKDTETGEWHLYWPNGWLITAHPSFAEAVRIYREAEVLATLQQMESDT
jgi:hypothetical protein